MQAEQVLHGLITSPPMRCLDIPAAPGLFTLVDELLGVIIDAVNEFPTRRKSNSSPSARSSVNRRKRYLPATQTPKKARWEDTTSSKLF